MNMEDKEETDLVANQSSQSIIEAPPPELPLNSDDPSYFIPFDPYTTKRRKRVSHLIEHIIIIIASL